MTPFEKTTEGLIESYYKKKCNSILIFGITINSFNKDEY
jgi:hypothetical protein